MSVSLPMVIAIAKTKHNNGSTDTTDIRAEITQIKQELEKAFDDIEITSNGIDFKANNKIITTLEFINVEEISNMIQQL